MNETLEYQYYLAKLGIGRQKFKYIRLINKSILILLRPAKSQKINK